MWGKRKGVTVRDFIGADARHGFEPALLSAVLSFVIVVINVRGADYPAQYFRAEVFRADGFTIWNNAWYSGHFTPSYSLIAPPLSAMLGPVIVTALSSIAASFFFGRLASLTPAATARWGALLFAVSTVSNVLIGRTAFALGLAVGLWALDAWFQGHRVLALVLAVLAGLSTPVASVFLGIAAGAIALDEALTGTRRFTPRPLSTAFWLTSIAPLAAFSVAFGSGGIFQFKLAALALCLVGAVGVVAVTDVRPVRFGALAGLTAAALFFFIENPMGGNFQRFPMFFAGAAAMLFARPNRRRIAIALAVIFTGWAVFPAGEATVDAYADPSQDEAYFAPLINYISWHGDDNSRVEIPFTLNHWEAHYVAREFSLARGWERQADREVNPLFYNRSSEPDDYHRWLLDRAVRWVALPDVALDNGGRFEAELLANEHDWLELVWENDNWKVWEVKDANPILSGPAELKHMGFDNVLIESQETGVSVLRIRHMPYWKVEGPATINATPDGLVEIHVLHPGEIKLSARFEWDDLFSDD